MNAKAAVATKAILASIAKPGVALLHRLLPLEIKGK
jgi:hypothetical protein